jgi:signal transduction histidine kinase
LDLARRPETRVVTDDFGAITDLDDGALALLGADRADAVGRPLAGFVVRADATRFRRALGRLRREGRVEVELALRGARSGPVAVGVVGLRAADTGRLVWGLRAARAPHAAPPSGPPEEPGRLLEAAQRRCAELTSAQEARDLSMAVLAHELRGPTAAILGWARLLRGPRVEAARRARALAVIEQSALRQQALIEDLMDAVRIAGDKLTIARAPVDLCDLVVREVEGAQPAAVNKQVALRAHAAGEAWVTGDARRLAQVVSNLLTNAIKFTPPDGRVAARVAASAGEVTLRVVDTGLGIARLDLPRVFDRFHQGAGAGGPAGGVGLGLFLVREIVQMHGGTVVAESLGPCLGATFTVTLPRAR